MKTTVSFGDWLEEELKSRNMKPADLIRISNIGKGTLSDIFSGRRKAGIDVVITVADALEIPREIALRAAGFLEPTKDTSETVEQIVHELKGMSKEEQQEYLAYIRWANNQRKKKK
jgi:Helix-turn-helix.